MGNETLAPWTLPCTRCDFYCLVFNRGARGADQGAGVEAAETMERHLEEYHPGVEWTVYLQELGTSTPREVRA